MAEELREPHVESVGPPDARRHPPNRLNALSDGIFAIAMTLLTLEIKLPDNDAAGEVFQDQFWTFLGSLGVFAVAFLITSQYWLSHHRVLSYVHTVDRRALQQAVISLIGVAALPVATNLIYNVAGHPQTVAAAAAILALTSLLSVRLYARILRPEFADIDPLTRRRFLVAPLLNAAVYVVTGVLAFVLTAIGKAPGIAFALWFLLPLNQPVTRRLVPARS